MNSLKIGILGLQGAFWKHEKMLDALDVRTEIIRYVNQIDKCNGIIIPGGESTTMSKLIDECSVREKLEQFRGPIFGTCAGAILLAKKTNDNMVKTLNRVPAKVVRNAYGRQIDSFIQPIDLTFDTKKYPAFFIRAPRIEKIENEVEILGKFNSEAVLIQYRNNLLATFHPELTEDLRIHKYFLKMVN
jgi:5'-phosphate synthase pdxT subunit